MARSHTQIVNQLATALRFRQNNLAKMSSLFELQPAPSSRGPNCRVSSGSQLCRQVSVGTVGVAAETSCAVSTLATGPCKKHWMARNLKDNIPKNLLSSQYHEMPRLTLSCKPSVSSNTVALPFFARKVAFHFRFFVSFRALWSGSLVPWDIFYMGLARGVGKLQPWRAANVNASHKPDAKLLLSTAPSLEGKLPLSSGASRPHKHKCAPSFIHV